MRISVNTLLAVTLSIALFEN